MSFEKALGRRIHEVRKSKHMSSDTLAELGGFSDGSYIRQIERGEKQPSLQGLINLCKALQVTPNYLLTEELEGIGVFTPTKSLVDKIGRLTPYHVECIESLADKFIELDNRDNIEKD